jgi:hypothetical protein
MSDEPLLLLSESIPMKTQEVLSGFCPIAILVLVVVSDDDGSAVGLLALEYQSPVYIQSLSFFGARFIRGSGSLCGSGTHLPRPSLIA